MRDGQLHRDKIYGALPEALLGWYAQAARDLPWRRDRAPYRVWVSEIMLQQTRVEAVREYYLRFLDFFPDVFALAAAPEDRLLKAWEGLGYYSRARNMQKTAKIIASQGGVFPAERDALLRLPGVGPYTAGAIASICFDRPEPAVDGNVLRVIARLTEQFTPMAPLKEDVARRLRAVYPEGRCGDFTQSLMELGATVCIPGAPRCGACPLAHICLAHKNGSAAALPVAPEKKARKIEYLTVFLLLANGRVALRRRKNAGLLAGMWEFPNFPGALSEAQARRALREMRVHVQNLRPPAYAEHVFTHIQWIMTCYVVSCGGEIGLPANQSGGADGAHTETSHTAEPGPAKTHAEPGGEEPSSADSAELIWVETQRLRDEYPLPTAFKKLLRSL